MFRNGNEGRRRGEKMKGRDGRRVRKENGFGLVGIREKRMGREGKWA